MAFGCSHAYPGRKTISELIAPTLRALADEDVLVVVTTGGRPLATLPPLPANARAAEFLPCDELLPRTAVYVGVFQDWRTWSTNWSVRADRELPAGVQIAGPSRSSASVMM